MGIRGWAGKPTHPPLTDIPIASYVLVAAMDVVSYVAARGNPAGRPGAVAHDFFVAGTIVLIAGGLVSLATATTGFWDWWKGQARRKTGPLGQAHHTQVWRTANWHMAVMVTVTMIVAVDIALRLAQFDRHAAQLPTMILSVLAGQKSVQEVIEEEQVSRTFYYQLEDRGLQGMMKGLSPRIEGQTSEHRELAQAREQLRTLTERVKSLTQRKRSAERLLRLLIKSNHARVSTERRGRPRKALSTATMTGGDLL